MPALNRRNRTSKAIPNDKVDQPLGEKKKIFRRLVQYRKKIVYGTAISSSSATSTSENADDS